MGDHRGSEILRLRTAALTCIFARSLTWFGYRRCRNGRCLRSCLPRSSRRPSCKPVPWRSLQTSHQISTSLLCVWNSFHCPRGVHSCIRREEMFIGFRGLAKPHATDKPRVCSTLPDFTSKPSTGRHGQPEQSCLNCTDALTAESWCCLNLVSSLHC